MTTTRRFHHVMPSPLGELHLGASDEGLFAMLFGCQISRDDAPGEGVVEVIGRHEHPIIERAADELDGYFAGVRTAFTVPLAPRGTPFQRAVWEALVAIPFGERRAYRDIARAIGRAGAERAVGAANGQNRIGIIIPCHRVVATSGALTGYAAGIESKRWLLAHEASARQGR
jgi:methylated-DNA-[protein]-cysteine S-methyltransferase